jgi:hypothetical protein
VSGATIAGLNVTYPVYLVSEDEIELLTRLTVEAAERISQRVGSLSFDASHRYLEAQRHPDGPGPDAARREAAPGYVGGTAIATPPAMAVRDSRRCDDPVM